MTIAIQQTNIISLQDTNTIGYYTTPCAYASL